MREIDFLPEWYKSSKRRKVNYRMQYLVVGGAFAVLMTWSFVASYSNSVVKKHIEIMQKSLDSHIKIKSKYENYNRELAVLSERVDRLDKLDSGINITSILAELSYLASDDVMLTDLDLKSEVMTNENTGQMKAGLVRLSAPKSDKKTAMPDPNVRYKFTLHGVASGAAPITDLISELEKSPYFCQVIPGLLEHVKESNCTRFEISCYIANYKMANG